MDTFKFFPPNIKQAILFVWFGNPISQSFQEKIRELKQNYAVYMLFDMQSVPDEKKEEFKTAIKDCEPIEIQFDSNDPTKTDTHFSSLENHLFSKKEIEILKRAYLYHLYGHDYYSDKDTMVNKPNQNFAAASDIARILGLFILQKKHKEYNYYIYLDHDVMPTPKMQNDPKVEFQVHHLNSMSPMVPPTLSENQAKDQLALNNAVIRINNKSSLCKDYLRLCAQRYETFFLADEKLRQLVTSKNPNAADLRIKSTFYLGGPHILETIGHMTEKPFTPQNFLYDNNGDEDFENNSAHTWLSPYSYQCEKYKDDPLSNIELFYLLSSVLSLLSRYLPENYINEKETIEEDKRRKLELDKLGFPSGTFLSYDKKYSDILARCALIQDDSDYKRFISLVSVPADHPIDIIHKLYLKSKPELFSFLTRLNKLVQNDVTTMHMGKINNYSEDELSVIVLSLINRSLSYFPNSVVAMNLFSQAASFFHGVSSNAKPKIVVALENSLSDYPLHSFAFYLNLVEKDKFYETRVFQLFEELEKKNKVDQMIICLNTIGTLNKSMIEKSFEEHIIHPIFNKLTPNELSHNQFKSLLEVLFLKCNTVTSIKIPEILHKYFINIMKELTLEYKEQYSYPVEKGLALEPLKWMLNLAKINSIDLSEFVDEALIPLIQNSDNREKDYILVLIKSTMEYENIKPLLLKHSETIKNFLTPLDPEENSTKPYTPSFTRN